MVRIDGERKKQGQLRLQVVRGQSRGQNAHIKIAPAIQLWGISLANEIKAPPPIGYGY